jgi:Aminoglycoside 3-N-acetyltransferase
VTHTAGTRPTAWTKPDLPSGPVTRSLISRALAALGFGDGDVVMFRTRMSAIGNVAGGPQTVIGALHDVVGPRGTPMVTCGRNDAPPMTSPPGHRTGRTPCEPNIPPTAAGSRCSALPWTP